MLSKEEFINAMQDIENTYRFQKSIISCYKKHNIEGYLVQPDCCATALRLIHDIYINNDKAEWIDTFCFKLDFGKKWEPGILLDGNGKEIKLENSEDLYNLLSGGVVSLVTMG